MVRRTLVALVLLGAGACGKNASLTIGGPCTSDSDCGSGPKCIASGVTTDGGGCMSQMQCWYVCQTDADCSGTEFGSDPTPKCYTGTGACSQSQPTCGPNL